MKKVNAPKAHRLPSGSWTCVVMVHGQRRSFTGDSRASVEEAAMRWKMDKTPTATGTLGEAITKYTEQPPRGEFVLVVAGAAETVKEAATAEDAAAHVAKLMEQGLSRKDAIKQTAKDLDLPKNVVYDAALNLE